MKHFAVLFWFFSIWIFLVYSSYNSYTNFGKFESLYISKDYSEIVNSWDFKDKNPESLHNIWNTYYHIFSEDMDDLISLQSAVNSYSWSLHLEEHPDTRYNYLFTKILLDSLRQQQTQENQEEEENSEAGEWNSESWEQPEWSNGEESSWDPSTQQWWEWEDEIIQDSRGQEYYLEDSEKVEDMTESEQALLERELEQLKLQQENNQQFFGKKPQETQFWNVFDSFFGWIDRGGEKDW